MNKTLIPQMLRQKRVASGLSAEEVIKKLSDRGIDISEKTLYGYENGVSTPKVNTFLCLCDIYGVKNIMSEFGYSYSLAINDNDWSLDQYNDFFNCPVLDKLAFLLQHGVPSFAGYESELERAFPSDAVRANFNRLYAVFSSLSENDQDYLFFAVDEIQKKRQPYVSSDEYALLSAYRAQSPDAQAIIRRSLGIPDASSAEASAG